MDLLKTMLIYMAVLFTSSAQSMPDVETIMLTAATPTPTYVQQTPAPTVTPTPVPTVEVSVNPEYKTLVLGSKGDEVLRLQETLQEYGYYTGEVDGRYGNQTRVAVELFQYHHGITADGIAGRLTQSVLYDSGKVRPAPEADATITPEVTEAPTDTPLPTFAPTQAPTDTPAPVTPAPTEDPELAPMEGWRMVISGQEQTFALYAVGDQLYVPFSQTLAAAGIIVLPSDMDAPGFAFAIGDDIYLLSYQLEQTGRPINLEIQKNGERQLLKSRDIRIADETEYLPCEAITGVCGITFEKNEEAKTLTVLLPGAEEPAGETPEE